MAFTDKDRELLKDTANKISKTRRDTGPLVSAFWWNIRTAIMITLATLFMAFALAMFWKLYI